MASRRKKDPFDLGSHVQIKHRTSAAHQDWVPVTPTQSSGRNPFILQRLLIISGTCLLILLILFIRLFSLQSHADTYKKMADNNRIRIVSQQAPRGIIYDRNNIALTANNADVGVFVTIDDLPESSQGRQDVFALISKLTSVSPEELQQRLQELQKTSSAEPLPLVDHVSHDQAILISVHENDLPGIYLTPRISREYPLSKYVANIIGYAGKMTDPEWEQLKIDPRYSYSDPKGKTGIELSFENALKGQNGQQRIEVDAYGHVSRIVASEDSVPGNNVMLSIDSDFQKYLYDELEKVSETINSPGASAIAQDPNTGEILALVSWPSYDNNLFSKGISQEEYTNLKEDPRTPLFNKPISGEYPSGSTIKPLIASAALQENIINPQTTVVSTGGIQIGQWNFPDWKSGGHGVTNVTKAIAQSVNTFFYAIGGGYQDIQGLGLDKIREYAERFGLNSKLGIDIPGEATGFIPTKQWKEETKGEKWYIGDTYHLAIGQGDLLVTPLQINSYVATIANGGTLYTPHLVITNSGVKVDPTIIRSNVIDDTNLEVVRAGMRETVLSGSAKSLQSLPVEVAAKTGTAEFGVDGKTHAWFTAFAPYENPTIVLTILIEEGGEGSTTAAPIAKNALNWWFTNRTQ
ncbi:MAG: penicillin-binding protein 2 [Patescibacteria group bacterium]|jgi:penicillin-binding protein 2